MPVMIEGAGVNTADGESALSSPRLASQPFRPSPTPEVWWSIQASVLSTNRFPEAVVPHEHSAYGRMLNSSANFAELFAELRAITIPNIPLCSSLFRW